MLNFASKHINQVHIDTSTLCFPEKEEELERFLDKVPDNAVILISLDKWHEEQARQRGKDLSKIVKGIERYIAVKKRLEDRKSVV